MFTELSKLKTTLNNAMRTQTDLSPEKCDEIVFHLTDWLDELERLCGIYQDAENQAEEDIHTAVLQFLIHAPAHVVAASELVIGLPFENTFAKKE